MIINAQFTRKPSSFQTEACQVEKVIELPAEKFDAFLASPGNDESFITEHSELMGVWDGMAHGILVLGKDREDGVLINSEGYDYSRYASYIPRARDIVFSAIEQGREQVPWKEESLRVLMVEPGKAPEVRTIPNTLKAMQEAVGGLIQIIPLEDDIQLVCNDEGKLIGLEGNRRVRNDIIVGNFFLAADGGEELCSLSEKEIEKYSQVFAEPQTFTQEEIESTNSITMIFW